jgi:site-specific recombinase XerD
MTKQDDVPVHGVAVTSTLVDHLMGCREELARSGYGPVRSGAHLELFADLCSWTAHQGLAPRELTSDRVAAFLADRRRRDHTDLVSVVGVAPLIGYLVRVGAIPEQVPVAPDDPERVLLERYRHYLGVERGLAPRGVDRYVTLADRFVATLERDGAIDWERVSAKDVTRYIVETSPAERSRHAPEIVSVLRSFLRFALLEGVIGLPLHGAVPPVAGWRMSPLPQGVAPDVLALLLESCDRTSTKGRRDYAILLLLSRLGLRAGEVAAMGLDDLDWRRGELTVHGKARRDEAMPLPADVGEAIADYLHHGRPETESRSVFLRLLAPRHGLSVPAVTGVVYDACDRVGVDRIGAHRLRHSAASTMLAGGASLAEVGEALRQRSATSTAIYAKVDRTRLSTLARPWPGSAR